MSAHSPPELEIIQVRYGERVTQKSVVMHEFSQYGEPDGDLQMDYCFWVVRSPTDTIMVDTGYDIPAKDWLGEQSVIPTPDALELLGVDPASVSMVIASHFHYDHIGYLGLFVNAQVVAAQSEYDYWFGKWDSTGLEGEFAVEDHLEAVKRAKVEGRLRLLDGPGEVYPGITVYPVGGHCPGQMLVAVQSAHGAKILATDAAHFYEQVDNQWPFFAFTSLEDMKSALAFMNRLADETGAEIIPGHDGRVREKHPELAGPASHVATLIG